MTWVRITDDTGTPTTYGPAKREDSGEPVGDLIPTHAGDGEPLVRWRYRSAFVVEWWSPDLDVWRAWRCERMLLSSRPGGCTKCRHPWSVHSFNGCQMNNCGCRVPI